MSGLQIGELAALGTALLWTLSALAWTLAGKHVGAVAIGFVRLVIACVLMIAYGYVVYGRWLPGDADAQTWLVLGASGVIGFFLCDLCLFKSMLLIGPRVALLIQSLVPPMGAVISWAYNHDVLATRQWMAMGVTLAGVVWVVAEGPSENGQPRVPGHHQRGVLLALLAAVAQAIGLALSRNAMGDYDDAVAATLIRGLAALPAYALLITIWRRWPEMLAAMRHVRTVSILTFGAVVGPFVGVALNMFALRRAPVGVVATIIATMPVLILPLSILVFHEKVSLRAVGGAVLAVVGVALLML
jgi:drug/metabolite transporter (DMT)-like permease